MLSYQHGYHAGGFADVIKHLTLSRLLTYLIGKDKPIFYLETHSGSGKYHLHNKQAAKTGESQQGIYLLWQQKEKLPTLFTPYLNCLRKINSCSEETRKTQKTVSDLNFYPGSPTIAIDILREQDRLYCCELHPREFECLHKLPHPGKRVFFSHSDGMTSLSALLPPPERRGLIFIDPSYEIKTEYKKIPQGIKAAHQHFATGIFCLWYPIVDKRLHEQLMRGMSAIPAKSALRIEFYLTPASQAGMTGCGLWILNPPYILAEEMKQALTYLQTIFNPAASSFRISSATIPFH